MVLVLLLPDLLLRSCCYHPQPSLRYIIECAVRAVKWSGVLVMHHTLSLTLFAVTMNSDNPPLGVIAVVLDLFTCHEVPL